MRSFLAWIGMSVLIDVFEKEMVDLDVLKEMSHEDLKSIGVNTFDTRF